MVRPILGGAVAGFTAGLVALAAVGVVRSGVWASPEHASLTATGGAAPAVQCGPYEQVVVDRVILNGQEAAVLRCAPRLDDRMVAYAPQPYAPPMAYVSQPAHTPAPAVARPAVQRTVSAPARERVVYVDREEDVRRGRSWAKTALILGGSAGTGAGVGGIVGGKKGALIGAAIGGGAASIYEATKR
jgi:hypothetical protein